MKVVLLFAPEHQQAVDLLYSACRQCYYSGFVGDVYPFEEVSNTKKDNLLKHVINSGHHSVLEHVSFTFAFGDLTRAAAQQLTRHRLASYSIQSMRYCNVENMNVHVPDKINNDREAYLDYLAVVNSAADYYRKYTSREENPIAFEDAREVLPIGWYSNLVMTMNCRELLYFFSVRLCKTAQQEIRTLAKEMLKICRERLPEVFESAGPKCKILGYCNEGSRSCHKAPLKEEVFKIYNLYKDKLKSE